MGNVYRTGPGPNAFQNGGHIVEGGPCTISQSVAAPGFYDLKAIPSGYGSNDYFYPWMQRGIGWVQVPKDTPDGTIVLTGGVNGCTIVVTEHLSSYFFYHDGDSRYLYPGMTTGNEIARIEPKDYDPLGWGEKMFTRTIAEAGQRGMAIAGDISYGHFVVAVKKEGRFGMYATGVMSFNGLTKLPVGLSTCIVTFA